MPSGNESSGNQSPAPAAAPSVWERLLFGAIVFLMITGWVFFPA